MDEWQRLIDGNVYGLVSCFQGAVPISKGTAMERLQEISTRARLFVRDLVPGDVVQSDGFFYRTHQVLLPAKSCLWTALPILISVAGYRAML